MRGAAGTAQGPSGVASPSRRSQELDRLCLPALQANNLRPQARPPQSARAPKRPGVGSLGTPRSHRLSRFCLLLWLSLQHRRLLGSPGVGGSRGPASAPFPSQAARRSWALCARTDYPTDGREPSGRTPGSRGWEAAVAALREGGGGGEGEEGEETDRGPKHRRR